MIITNETDRIRTIFYNNKNTKVIWILSVLYMLVCKFKLHIKIVALQLQNQENYDLSKYQHFLIINSIICIKLSLFWGCIYQTGEIYFLLSLDFYSVFHLLLVYVVKIKLPVNNFTWFRAVMDSMKNKENWAYIRTCGLTIPNTENSAFAYQADNIYRS